LATRNSKLWRARRIGAKSEANQPKGNKDKETEQSKRRTKIEGREKKPTDASAEGPRGNEKISVSTGDPGKKVASMEKNTSDLKPARLRSKGESTLGR